MIVTEEWTATTLGEVATWSSGGTPRATNPEYYGGEIPWAVIGDLADGVVRETASKITEKGLKASSAKLVPPGTILVAMYGTIGKLGIAGMEMATNQAIACAQPNDAVEAVFLFWYLHSIRHALRRSGKGATQTNISQTILKAWPINVPSMGEQRRIVAAIEEQFSRVSAAESSIRRAAANLTQLKAALDLERFVGGWKSVELQSLVRTSRPICYGILMPKEHRDDGVPYVRVKDYPDGRIELAGLRRTSQEIADKYRRSTLREGDVLLAIRGTFGRVAMVPPELEGGNITQDTARISATDDVLPRYLAAYLGSEAAHRYYRRVARGVAVRGVNLGDVKTMPIPLPLLADQARIVATHERDESLTRALEGELGVSLDRCRAIRGAVLRDAFSGHLSNGSVRTEEQVSLA